MPVDDHVIRTAYFSPKGWCNVVTPKAWSSDDYFNKDELNDIRKNKRKAERDAKRS